MKAALFVLIGAVALCLGGSGSGFLPEAAADVIRRAMYINAGGKPVYNYVYQADRRNLRSWRRGYDSSNRWFGSDYYFGSSYSSYPSNYYPVHSYGAYPVRYGYRGFGGHRGYHGYHGGYHGGFHAHGAFSAGSLRVHFSF